MLSAAYDIPADDLSQEIAVLRQRLGMLVKERPELLDLLAKGMRALAYLAGVHYRMSGNARAHLVDGMEALLEDFRLTLSLAEEGRTAHGEDAAE